MRAALLTLAVAACAAFDGAEDLLLDGATVGGGTGASAGAATDAAGGTLSAGGAGGLAGNGGSSESGAAGSGGEAVSGASGGGGTAATSGSAGSSGGAAGSAGTGGAGLTSGSSGTSGTGPAVCPPGFGNCDGNDGNGCETGVLSSTAHCGTCGHQCNLPSAVSGCSNGICVVTSCLMGRGNCDADEANGCETNTTNTRAHCGACGAACSPANATGICQNSQCQVATCSAAKFKNCNGLSGDGCEVDISTDPDHCEGCGMACTPGFICNGCVSGICSGAFGCLCDSSADCGGTCNMEGRCQCGFATCGEGEVCAPMGCG